MRRLIICPYCAAEDVPIIGFEDGGGDDGESLTNVYGCAECGHNFTADECDKVYVDDADEQPYERWRDGYPPGYEP